MVQDRNYTIEADTGGSTEILCPRILEPLILKKKRYKIIIGGRGSAKSQTVGDLSLKDVATKGLKIGCFREYMNSIDDSVHSLLSD